MRKRLTEPEAWRFLADVAPYWHPVARGENRWEENTGSYPLGGICRWLFRLEHRRITSRTAEAMRARLAAVFGSRNNPHLEGYRWPREARYQTARHLACGFLACHAAEHPAVFHRGVPPDYLDRRIEIPT